MGIGNGMWILRDRDSGTNAVVYAAYHVRFLGPFLISWRQGLDLLIIVSIELYTNFRS